jgi:hypothetical protein
MSEVRMDKRDTESKHHNSCLLWKVKLHHHMRAKLHKSLDLETIQRCNKTPSRL